MDNASKFKIVEKIIQSNDDALLNKIESLVGLSSNDFWNDLSTDVRNSITKGKKELDCGQGIPHEKVMAEIKNRYNSK